MVEKKENNVCHDIDNNGLKLNVEEYNPLQEVDTYFYNRIELIYLKYGEARIEIEDETIQISEDELVFIPPLSQYSIKVISKIKIIRLLIPATFFSEFNGLLYDKTLPFKMSDRTYNKETILKLLEISDDLISNEKLLKNLTENSFVNLLMGCLISRYELISYVRQDMLFLEKINKYIHDNYKSDLSVDMLAREFGYNKTYFSRLFHAKTGMLLRDYINNVRVKKFVERYKEINANKTKMLDLILDCGFSSVATFYRCFKRRYKITPSKYFGFDLENVEQ